MDDRARTLADHLVGNVGWSSTVPKKLRKSYLSDINKVRSAHKFVFSPEASREAGSIIASMMGEMIDHQEFATPPFERMWLEYWSQDMVEGLGGRYQNHIQADDLVGYLIDRNHVKIYVGGVDIQSRTLSVIRSPVEYRLQIPLSFEGELEEAQEFGISRMIARMVKLGSSYPDLTDSQRRAFCGSHTMLWNERVMPTNTTERAAYMQSLAGELRVLVGILLLLNRPRNFLRVQDMPRVRKFISGRQKTYYAHSHITFHLKGRPAIQAFKENLGEWGGSRRYHDVRGHYCQSRKPQYRRCDHEWDRLSETQWQCVKCGCPRWWRKEHHRGDLDVGVTGGDYHVDP